MVLLSSRLGSLVTGIGQLYEASLFLEDFTGFVDALPALSASPTRTIPAPDRFSTLVVDSATFTYPSRTEPSLREVSMEIRAGQVVALVGENGSGKTTLAKLLAGLYTPDQGAVLWDGLDVSKCEIEGLRRSVAVIFQDFVRYQLTAHENIGLGRAERLDDREAVRAASVTAGADNFLSTLDRGYDTRLGPQFFGGTDLSVGQWQRVALARALFRDCPFVILDEPTAALDPRAERELFEGLRSVFTGRTALVVSHRFANVRSADRIYVLAAGRIVEHGSHQDLMAGGGLYAELFTLQASTYVDTP
jgi:ATP-binding cassette subfamily B protein